MTKIFDEFSDLPISRQERYQLRRLRENHCILCRNPRSNGTKFCERHRVMKLDIERKRAEKNKKGE